MIADEPKVPPLESRPGLLRALGLWAAVAVVIGNVIGSGIFLKPSTVARHAGEFQVVLAAWVGGGVLSLLGALCFAELAAMLPRAGGLYVYLREAYGRPVAFLFGWTDFLFTKPGSVGALAAAFVSYLAQLVPIGAMGQVVVSVAAIVALSWVNFVGVVWGGRVQTWTTLVKAGSLVVVAVLPFALGRFEWANFSTRLASGAEPPAGGMSGFALALLAVLWAYNGWHDVTPVAEEVHEPQRNLPLALVGGVVLLIVLYVSANVAYHATLPIETLAASGEGVGYVFLEHLLGPWGGKLMAAFVMCSTFGAMNSTILTGPRVAFAMGRDRVFFRQLGYVHVTNQTPAVAIVVQGAMATGLVVVSALLVRFVPWFQEHDRAIFDILTDFVIFGASIFYLLAAAAVVVLRYKEPAWPRPYRTWGYPVVPALFVGAYAWFLWQVFWQQPDASLAGLGLIGLGLPVYLFSSRRNSAST